MEVYLVTYYYDIRDVQATEKKIFLKQECAEKYFRKLLTEHGCSKEDIENAVDVWEYKSGISSFEIEDFEVIGPPLKVGDHVRRKDTNGKFTGMYQIVEAFENCSVLKGGYEVHNDDLIKIVRATIKSKM